VRGRAYDDVAHQQAAMPEQLLAPGTADPRHDDQDPDVPLAREAIGMTALRALRESRTDVEALDLTAGRLRSLQDAFTKAGGNSRHPRSDRHTARADARTRGGRPHRTGRHRRGPPG
jgi:hypothetical protein